MLKQAKLYWLYVAKWECRSRPPLFAWQIDKKKIEYFHEDTAKRFMENQCNFQTARPAFYSGVLLRFEYQSPRKQTKINGDLNWFHILKLLLS